MVDLWGQRSGDCLAPIDAESWGEFSKIPFGKPLHIEIKQKRNPLHHRKFFALVHRMANALGVNSEALRAHLTVRAGHVNIVKTKDGIREYPASIAFSTMDQTEFNDFFNRCVVIIAEDWGMRRPDVLDAVRDLIDGGLPERK